MKLTDCWAKTDPVTGHPAISVVEHCRLVGHVADVLLESLAPSLRHALPTGSTSLVAAHDLGKITPGFQLKCSHWHHHAKVHSSIFHNKLETNHAAVSAWHLAHAEPFHLPGTSARWLVSTGGHHGAYHSGFSKPAARINEGAADGIHPLFHDLRNELIRQLIHEFGPLPQESAAQQQIRTHLLTGFTIFADWLGSNTDWFPLAKGCDPERIRDQSRAILRAFGYPLKIRSDLQFNELFQTSATKSFSLRPLQETLIQAASQPGLFIVEASMGAGKTEAALAAAYRRWCVGEERGLYFALPSQLTSGKIHDRIHSFLANILDAPAFQSLIHGNAWLDDQHNRAVGSNTDDDANDTDEALRWFSSTRRQLLTPFGTGTIDQALLAILPARFAALRHFALAGKIIVIDEVHAYDTYMSTLIDRLIQFLLPTGASVIILSATLTAARRAELVAAAGARENDSPSAYPLVTKVATGTILAEHFPVADPHAPKTVCLEKNLLSEETEDDYWQSIADQVNAGANVVVIRNTVALAQETYRHLKSLLRDFPAEHTGLIHSRFTHAHRLENEENWMRLLGKDAQHRPSGSLLVSTQIVEQSVDIDADLLVTDLAPIELILQRIGRLQRHPHQRPVGCEQPVCHILHPQIDWHADAPAIEAALAPHHFIYPPLALWQASQMWQAPPAPVSPSCPVSPTPASEKTDTQRSRIISLPRDIRPILESAAAATPDPEILQAFAKFLPDSQRHRLDQLGTAKIRDVFAQAIDDKEGRETRYRIQPTAHLVLLTHPPEIRGETIALHFVHGEVVTTRVGFFSYPLARALHRNAIRIPAYLVRETVKSSPEWLRLHLSDAVLAIQSTHSADLELYPDSKDRYSFEHTSAIGLTWKKATPHPRDTSEPEDFWF